MSCSLNSLQGFYRELYGGVLGIIQGIVGVQTIARLGPVSGGRIEGQIAFWGYARAN